jgi:hypothetical protein
VRVLGELLVWEADMGDAEGWVASEQEVGGSG